MLVVDDEPYNVLGLLLTISRLGIEGLEDMVDRSYNGLEALRKVESSFNKGHHTYGLIITDISMPVMDGYESTQKIREFYRAKNVL